MFLPILGVITTMNYSGDVPAAGGDYVDVEFAVPAGTVEIKVAHADESDYDIRDWGVWAPEGFRGWGGGNTEDAIIGVSESSRSYLIGPITPGTWRVSIGKAKLDTDGGHYEITVTCYDAPTLVPRARAAYSPAPLAEGRRWYKGDFHVHSSESGDADASLDQIGELAKSRGLDFVNLSDHNTSSHLPLAAARQPSHPDVLFLRGAEITTYAGHGNAVGLPSYIDHRIGFQNRTIEGILGDVEAQGALFIVNHPALELGDNCIGCAWKHPTTPWDKVAGLEIITGKWDLVERLFTPIAIAKWDELEAQGFRLAAIGGSDDHRAGTGTGDTDTPIGSPTTLVLADSLSEAALVEGIRAGRTIVQLRGPDDPFVEVTMTRADGTAAEIGDDIDGIASVTMPIHITGGAGNLVQLWRDGVKLSQAPITSDDFRTTLTDTPGAGDFRYRVELINDSNNRIVVTSHFYVSAVADSGGCCDAGGPAGALPGLLLALTGLLPRWRRRRARTPSRPRA
ncbi:MAG TPA: CehA/McbA family metallohydrolase [Kofleriaceae bacterium]